MAHHPFFRQQEGVEVGEGLCPAPAVIPPSLALGQCRQKKLYGLSIDS